MDRKQLEGVLEPFKRVCAERGRPLESICIEDAFPGDNATSFIVQVKAPWVDNMDCSAAIDFLFEILWETTNEETRRKIFSIQVLDSHDQFHCLSETAA